jgi:hypothetical protein
MGHRCECSLWAWICHSPLSFSQELLMVLPKGISSQVLHCLWYPGPTLSFVPDGVGQLIWVCLSNLLSIRPSVIQAHVFVKKMQKVCVCVFPNQKTRTFIPYFQKTSCKFLWNACPAFAMTHSRKTCGCP